MIDYETTVIACVSAFVLGFIFAISMRYRRSLNLLGKLATATTRTDELTTESFDLRRQLHDVKFLLEMRVAECTKLRAELKVLRFGSGSKPKLVTGDGPKGAA